MNPIPYWICVVISLYGIPGIFAFHKFKTMSPVLPWRVIRESLTVFVILITLVVSFIPIVNLLVSFFIIASLVIDLGTLFFTSEWLRSKPFAKNK
jgi:hypothetical protein